MNSPFSAERHESPHELRSLFVTAHGWDSKSCNNALYSGEAAFHKIVGHDFMWV